MKINAKVPIQVKKTKGSVWSTKDNSIGNATSG